MKEKRRQGQQQGGKPQESARKALINYLRRYTRNRPRNWEINYAKVAIS